jgi:hypothetical protein
MTDNGTSWDRGTRAMDTVYGKGFSETYYPSRARRRTTGKPSSTSSGKCGLARDSQSGIAGCW